MTSRVMTPPTVAKWGYNLFNPTPRDAAALAHALERLACDGTLRGRLSSAARQRIELEFDARKEALKLHRLMAEAIANAT